MKLNRRAKRASAGKDMAAGAIAGLTGAAVMTGFQKIWSTLQKRQSEASSGGNSQHADEPATVKAAGAVSEAVLRRPIPDSRKPLAGSLVHYSFGAFNGAVYRALSRKLPLAETGHGTLYGAALWAVADETIVPAAGLSKPAKENPPSSHIYGLASHVAYGLATDTTYRIVRHFL